MFKNYLIKNKKRVIKETLIVGIGLTIFSMLTICSQLTNIFKFNSELPCYLIFILPLTISTVLIDEYQNFKKENKKGH